jgi:excinuclease ABC subunit A
MTIDISQQDPKKNILIKGAKLHNLKNIDVVIPRNKLVVITGLSGSGKSSLAMDTLFAEGQRRYVESLSSYARQFLGRLNKPKVDYIKGISPAIAIEQKVNTTNTRSTVGTSTEIYDYLKLLYARAGKTYSPKSGKEVKKQTVTDVIEKIKSYPEKTKLLLLSPCEVSKDRTLLQTFKILTQQGYARVKINGKVEKIEDIKEEVSKEFLLVIDRIIVRHEEDFYNRLGDAIQTAFFDGKGACILEEVANDNQTLFNNCFELDGQTFLEPSTHLFSFNNPYGACPTCEGHGSIIGIDKNLVIPDQSLSILEGCIAPWQTSSFKSYQTALINHADAYDISIHKAWHELSEESKELIWKGTKSFKGLDYFFKQLQSKIHKIHYRVLLSRYRGKTKCTDCEGKRLRKEASYVKIDGKNILELVNLQLNELAEFFKNIKLTAFQQKIAHRILIEINNRLKFLNDVGLSYLTLNRASNTLSGGESQRINLATSLGSSLVGSMYILDEPSIGLHSKDTALLIKVLKNLRDLGNTVIVVEHDEDIMKASDLIIDIGPEAGTFGGQLVAQGTYKELLKQNSLTSEYLSGKRTIALPKERRSSEKAIHLKGAFGNNLKNLDVSFPLNSMVVVTGVSGSGKSTLVNSLLYPGIMNYLKRNISYKGHYSQLDGDLEDIQSIEYIDQNPIGKTSRSTPVTYVKAYDDIRFLFASLPLSKNRQYLPKHFSFNVDGGRCDVCKGEGEVTIGMQFMADVTLPCDACNGKRFKKEILEVTFQGKSISDVLHFTVDEAIAFFKEHEKNTIVGRIQPLQDVGLGYVSLGQSSATLSGGEAQRIKLATFLGKGFNKTKTLFIFDEPTTGLHFHDINKLLKSFNALIEKGHSIIVVEHNMDLIKCADYVIDLGPEGGKNGGHLIFQGTPEELIKIKESETGKYLKEKLPSTAKK